MTDNFLHALVATLSTGPVGFSDALGFTNASLVKSTCASDGALLKPSLPLAAIDRTFSIRSNNSHGVAPPVPALGHVWATHTTAADLTWWFVLAITVPEPWRLLRTDLYPVLPLSEQVVVYDHRDPIGTAQLIQANESVLWEIRTPAAKWGYHGFQYLVIAPLIPTSDGWFLLGELAKLTPVSEQRGWSFDLAEGFLLKILSAAPGENVTVSAWKGGKVQTKSTVADDRGEAPIMFGHSNAI